MKARLWINHLLSHGEWNRCEIDWEAVDEIDEKLNELEKIKRENYGLKQTIANFKEKQEKHYNSGDF